MQLLYCWVGFGVTVTFNSAALLVQLSHEVQNLCVVQRRREPTPEYAPTLTFCADTEIALMNVRRTAMLKFFGKLIKEVLCSI
jgi:hypothetical protein